MGGPDQTQALGRKALKPQVFSHAPGDFNNVWVLASGGVA